MLAFLRKASDVVDERKPDTSGGEYGLDRLLDSLIAFVTDLPAAAP
jgi:hypothetical protein